MKDLKRFEQLFDLTGEVAIVTGASQGNGAAIANALHAAGAEVIGTDVAFPEESCQLVPEIKHLYMDVTNEDEIVSVFKKVAEEYGKITILCNNAGIMYKDRVEDLDMARFEKVTDVNLHGVVACTKNVVPYMRKAGGGRIVNIASSQSFLTSETYSAYSASKVAVSHLTRIWGEELAKDNILVNALCPCFVKTPMMVNSIAKKTEEFGGDAKLGESFFTDQIPLGRILEPEEIGNWVTLLCGKIGASTTGSNISVTLGQVKL
ncbi:MAG: SDR family oxidoreductase [Lachnospiraceae bacterium]|jgi:NAD(P)-dependent dehydrogenase (short-subunit alcohol dehydrogenase family)|nr:SDR family oxidoreductase [Lachnospiraceae bacterium]